MEEVDPVTHVEHDLSASSFERSRRQEKVFLYQECVTPSRDIVKTVVLDLSTGSSTPPIRNEPIGDSDDVDYVIVAAHPTHLQVLSTEADGGTRPECSVPVFANITDICAVPPGPWASQLIASYGNTGMPGNTTMSDDNNNTTTQYQLSNNAGYIAVITDDMQVVLYAIERDATSFTVTCHPLCRLDLGHFSLDPRRQRERQALFRVVADPVGRAIIVGAFSSYLYLIPITSGASRPAEPSQSTAATSTPTPTEGLPDSDPSPQAFSDNTKTFLPVDSSDTRSSMETMFKSGRIDGQVSFGTPEVVTVPGCVHDVSFLAPERVVSGWGLTRKTPGGSTALCSVILSNRGNRVIFVYEVDFKHGTMKARLPLKAAPEAAGASAPIFPAASLRSSDDSQGSGPCAVWGIPGVPGFLLTLDNNTLTLSQVKPLALRLSPLNTQPLYLANTSVTDIAVVSSAWATSISALTRNHPDRQTCTGDCDGHSVVRQLYISCEVEETSEIIFVTIWACTQGKVTYLDSEVLTGSHTPLSLTPSGLAHLPTGHLFAPTWTYQTLHVDDSTGVTTTAWKEPAPFGPVWDVVSGGSTSPCFFVATGQGKDGCVRRCALGYDTVQYLSTGEMSGVAKLWTLLAGDSVGDGLKYLILSFAKETRVMTVGAELEDVTLSSGFVSDEPTLLASRIAWHSSSYLQVTPKQVRPIDSTSHTSSSPGPASWRPKNNDSISSAHCSSQHLLVCVGQPTTLVILTSADTRSAPPRVVASLATQQSISCAVILPRFSDLDGIYVLACAYDSELILLRLDESANTLMTVLNTREVTEDTVVESIHIAKSPSGTVAATRLLLGMRNGRVIELGLSHDDSGSVQFQQRNVTLLGITPVTFIEWVNSPNLRTDATTDVIAVCDVPFVVHTSRAEGGGATIVTDLDGDLNMAGVEPVTTALGKTVHPTVSFTPIALDNVRHVASFWWDDVPHGLAVLRDGALQILAVQQSTKLTSSIYPTHFTPRFVTTGGRSDIVLAAVRDESKKVVDDLQSHGRTHTYLCNTILEIDATSGTTLSRCTIDSADYLTAILVSSHHTGRSVTSHLLVGYYSGSLKENGSFYLQALAPNPDSLGWESPATPIIVSAFSKRIVGIADCSVTLVDDPTTSVIAVAAGKMLTLWAVPSLDKAAGSAQAEGGIGTLVGRYEARSTLTSIKANPLTEEGEMWVTDQLDGVSCLTLTYTSASERKDDELPIRIALSSADQVPSNTISIDFTRSRSQGGHPQIECVSLTRNGLFAALERETVAVTGQPRQILRRRACDLGMLGVSVQSVTSARGGDVKTRQAFAVFGLLGQVTRVCVVNEEEFLILTELCRLAELRLGVTAGRFRSRCGPVDSHAIDGDVLSLLVSAPHAVIEGIRQAYSKHATCPATVDEAFDLVEALRNPVQRAPATGYLAEFKDK